MSEAPLRNLASNRLDEIARFAGDDGFDIICDVRVTDGVGQIVALGVQIEFQHDIDDERLALAALLWEDAVEARGRQARERDAVDFDPPSVC